MYEEQPGKPADQTFRRNAPVSYLPGGWPVKASNRRLMLGQRVERFASTSNASHKVATEEAPVAEDGLTWRRRVEVMILGPDGLLCIRKPQYLLLPGGAVDEGETDEQACIRETLEEAAWQVRDLTRETSYRVCPPPGHPICKGSDGVQTVIFSATPGQEWPGDHPDREEFAWLPVRDALDHLAKCVVDLDAEWDLEGNTTRLEILARLQGETKEARAPGGIRNLEDHTDIKQYPPGTRATLYDLDGTLRDWADGGWNDPEAIRALPGRHARIRDLVDRGHLVLGVTNHTQDGRVTSQGLRDSQVRTQQLLPGLTNIFWSEYPDPKLLKPHPAMLQEAMRLYGLDPKNTTYVGDQDTDREAAEAAGMRFETAADHFATQTKQADVPVVIPRAQYLLFNHSGQVMARKAPGRRYEFPNEGQGKRVPYQFPVRYLPEGGVPEPGVHGYEVSWLQGDQEGAPAGYEPQDPQEVLKSLYGSMGLAQNRQYQGLDRGTAQALLRAVRARKAQQPEVALVDPSVPVQSPVDPGSVTQSVPDSPHG